MLALFRTREIIFAPNALARIAFEHAVRAVPLLDSGAAHSCWRSPKRRTAAAGAVCDALDTMPYSMNVPPADAAVLDDLAALLDRPRDLYLDVYERQHGWTPAAGSLAEAELTSSLVLAGVVETELTSSLPAGDVSAFLVNHPRSVASLHVRLSADYLAGVGVKVGEYWSDLRADSVPAEGFYDVLSLYVHPQSFPSRHEASFDPETGESWLTADMDLLRKASMGALAAWIDAAGLLYGYQGWIVPELDELTEAGAALNP